MMRELLATIAFFVALLNDGDKSRNCFLACACLLLFKAVSLLDQIYRKDRP